MIAMTWSDIVLGIVKANDVRLVLLTVKIDDQHGAGRGGALDA
jgi:hypothetical protein